MKKIKDIINRLWNVCGQMEVGALLTCGSGIKSGISHMILLLAFSRDLYKNMKRLIQIVVERNQKCIRCCPVHDSK